MKKLGSFFIVLLFLLGGCKENNPVEPQEGLKLEFQRIIDSLYSNSGVSTGIIVNIKIPADGFNFQYAAGFSDKVNKIPITAQHKVCIASNTKTFVAALILILKEQNKLSLDDKLTKYFDASLVDSLCVFNNKSYGDEITIRMLLNHTSGIPDFESDQFILSFLESPYEFWSPLRTIRYAAANIPATNIPGREFHYSNTNYNLLGLIAEKAGGGHLHDLLRTHIYIPARIYGAYMNGYEQVDGIVAKGYFLDSIEVSSYNMSWEWACGGIMSTMEEMNLFLTSLFAGKLFTNPSTLTEMLHFENDKYALGVLQLNRDNFHFIGHTGGALGYSSIMLYEKNLDAYFSIVANSSGESDLFLQALLKLAAKIPNRHN